MADLNPFDIVLLSGATFAAAVVALGIEGRFGGPVSLRALGSALRLLPRGAE